MSDFEVGVVVGSLSSTSINRRLAKALAAVAPAELALVDISISGLPLYSPDYDAAFPAVATEFKSALSRSDGLIFVTPEYSRSVPGALKNALDWAARPYPDVSVSGKPCAVIGTSEGPMGAVSAQLHLKQILHHLDVVLMPKPDGFIQSKPGLFGDDGQISDPGTSAFLASYLASLLALTRRTVGS